MTEEHVRVGTELIDKIQDLIGEHIEGYVKVYFDKNNELDANWFVRINDLDVIVEGENYIKTRSRYIVTYDVREKPFKQMEIVQPILTKVNLGEKND